MTDSKPTGELHLRVVGQTTDWRLLLHGEPPTEDDLASWMQEGMVSRILVAEQGSNQPYTLVVNFALVVSARVLSVTGGRGVSF
ncbi:MAG: hypothetical protein JWO67_6137 [Streptosporangiaceae bacterium]|jgi:hypothetical protein|nr:hypothetical protein [Streptosporangiaceae bacterium]